MTASSEPVAGHLVRVHPAGGHYRAHSPYSWACVAEEVFRGDHSRVCEIKGVTSPGSPAAWRAAEHELRRLGFTHRFYLRHTPRGDRADFREL